MKSIDCGLCGDPQKSTICFWCRQVIQRSMNTSLSIEESTAYVIAVRKDRFNPRGWNLEGYKI